MTDQFTMLDLMTSQDSSASTSSPGSAAGIIPSLSPDGPGQSGPAPARVSRSRSPEHRRVSTTHGIFGPSSSALSPSDDLQRSLENRLRARLNGSDLCEVNWKRWDTPWGQCLSKPRARVRTISGTDTGLWLTPHCPRAHDSDEAPGKFYPSKRQMDVVAQATWATPAARDWRSDRSQKSSEEIYGAKGRPLPRQVIEAMPWPTPTSLAPAKYGQNEAGNSAGLVAIRKHAMAATWSTPRASPNENRTTKATPSQIAGKHGQYLAVQAIISNGSSEPTEKPGALNPEFVCWLMGYPIEWVSCGVSVTRSTQGRQRNSSPPRVTP